MPTYYVDPAAGGANDGSSWTDAWVSLQSAIDYVSLAAGDIIYCRGTQIVSATIDCDGTIGTHEAPIKIIGCNASGTVDGTRFVLDANSNNVHVMTSSSTCQYYWFINIAFVNSGNGSGFYFPASDPKDLLFVNCRFGANNQHGFQCGATYPQNVLFKQCLFDNNGVSGIYRGYGNTCYFCRFDGNGTYGWETPWGFCVTAGCVFDDCGISIYGYGPGNRHLFLTTNGGTIGFRSFAVSGTYMLGWRATNHSTVAYYADAAEREVLLDYVYTDGTFNETAGSAWRLPDKTNTTHIVTSGTDTNDGYVTGEFNLDSDATYRAEAIEVPSS